MAQKILIVEDDPLMRNIMQKVLVASGYEVTVASDGYEAINKIKEQSYDLIVSDVRMPGIDGIETMAQAKQIQPNVKSVIVTAFADEHAPVRAVNLGVDAYLYKPFEIKDFLDIIKKKLGNAVKNISTASLPIVSAGNAQFDSDMVIMIKTLVDALGIEKALEAVRQTAQSQSNLKIVGIFQQLHPDAEKKNESVLKRCRDLLRLSSAYIEMGEVVVARHGYLEALSIAGEDADPELKIEIFLGLAMSGYDNYEEAVRHLEKAKDIAPETSSYWKGQVALTKGKILEKLGRLDEAKDCIAEAKILFRESEDPYHLASSLFYLANIELRLSKDEAAFEHINLLLDMAKSYPLFNFFIQESIKAMPMLIFALKKKMQIDIVMAIFKKFKSIGAEAIQSLLNNEDPAVRRIAMELHEFAVNEKLIHFRAYCLGRLRVFSNALWIQDDQWSKEDKAVFAYILLNDETNEEELTNLFWPSLSKEEGKLEVRRSVSNIRKLLEPYLTDELQSTYILSHDGKFTFNRERSILCDLVVFKEQYDIGIDLEESGKLDKALNSYLEAERNYGGAFMEGHDFPWVIEYRDRYRKLYWEVLSKIVKYYENKKEYIKSIPFARKMLVECPEKSESHIVLIRNLWEVGRRKEAHQQLEVTKTILGSLPVELEQMASAIAK